MQTKHGKQEIFKAKAASFNSSPEFIERIFGYCYQIVTANQSSIVASAILQASIDGGVWTDIVGTSHAITTNETFMWNVSGAFYGYVRLAVTVTSGSADFTINSLTKGA